MAQLPDRYTPPRHLNSGHRDPEDLKIINVFTYLADVDELCGPFTYVPRTHPFGAAVGKALKKWWVSDDQMSRVFPSTLWRTCTGQAHTTILADTLDYHRGGKPTSGRRILIASTYTSGAP